MNKILSCEFNTDTASVELKFTDGSMISIYCAAVEDEVAHNTYQRSELYRLMNGMELREMDKIICPVCTLCRDHERSGFIEGIKVGIRLKDEIIA